MKRPNRRDQLQFIDVDGIRCAIIAPVIAEPFDALMNWYLEGQAERECRGAISQTQSAATATALSQDTTGPSSTA